MVKFLDVDTNFVVILQEFCKEIHNDIFLYNLRTSNVHRSISTLSCRPQKLVDKCIYLVCNISSTVSAVNTRLAEVWSAIDRFSIIWKFDISYRIKLEFLKAMSESILQYGCTTFMLTKCMEKKLHGSISRILSAVLNKSWKQ